MVMQQKINQIMNLSEEEKCNKYSPSINSHASAVSNNFSPTGAMNPCHTVTHVIHNGEISLDHSSNEGLDFILSHLQEPIWPRTISTKATDGRQVIVNSKKESLAYFKAANYLDCRISAYPYWRSSPLSDFVGIKNIIPPNLIMIDLDSSNVNDKSDSIKSTLRKTLMKINHLLHMRPSVIWSGNGYHIYVPIYAVVLEDIQEFTDVDQISTKFLRFAEWYLSSGKSDPVHNSTVSLNNCMLRVPATFNSKNNARVEIIRKWDNNRPKITLLLGSFCAYLKDKKLKEQKFLQQRAASISAPSTAEKILWIEKLLQTPIKNGRKYCIWRILVPYLINRKRLSAGQSTCLIMDWLNKCAKPAGLNFNPRYRIVYAIKHVGKCGPVDPNTIGKEHDALYKLLKIQGVL